MNVQGERSRIPRRGPKRTVEEKYAIIKIMKNSNKTIEELAIDFDIVPATLRKWMRDFDDMQAWVELNNKNNKSICKRLRAVELKMFGEAAFAWYHQSMNKGLRRKGRQIIRKVVSFNQKIGHNRCLMITSGWLQHWQCCYGIKLGLKSFRKAAKATDDTKKYKKTFKEAIENSHLSQDQVFSCFETALYYKILPEMPEPNEPLTSNFDKNEKFTYNDVIRVMVCSNASGTFKLPLLIVGRYRKPRGFEDAKIDQLPVFYTYQTNAWISGKSFFEWYTEQFVPRVKEFLNQRKLPPKALLLIESVYLNATNMCYTQSGLEVTILHCGAKNELRTMNQRVLENLKRGYRFRLVMSILGAQDNENTELSEIVKIINVRDAIYWIADAWDDVPSWDIRNSWKKLWPCKRTIVKEEFSIDPMLSDKDLTIFARKIDNMSELTQSEVSKWILHDDANQEDLSDDQILRIVAENNYRPEKFGNAPSPWIKFDYSEKEEKDEDDAERENLDSTFRRVIRRRKKKDKAWNKFQRQKVNSSCRYNLRSDKREKRLTRFSTTTGVSEIGESASPCFMGNGLSTRRMSIVDQSEISNENVAPPRNSQDELTLRLSPINASEFNDNQAFPRQNGNGLLTKITTIIGSEFEADDADSSGHMEDQPSPSVWPVNESEIHDNHVFPENMETETPITITSVRSSEFNENLSSPQDTKSEIFSRISSINSSGFHDTNVSLRNPKNEQLTIVSTISDGEFHHSLSNVITYCEENNVDPEYLSVLQHLRDSFSS